MIYAAFTLWLFSSLLVGLAVHALWSRLVGPRAVNWTLFPGTVVSEMAYIFGYLITGGEIRRARLVPEGGGSGEPTTEATEGVRFVSSLVASLLAVGACAGAILGVQAALGEPVLAGFVGEASPDGSAGEVGRAGRAAIALPQALPTNWDGFWAQLHLQLDIARRFCDTLAELEWSNWRVGLFIYLALCLSVRLAPVGRDLRGTLAAVVIWTMLVAIVGAISESFRELIRDVWPLLSYVWASLLVLLAATGIIHGIVGLVAVLSGKRSPGRSRAGGRRRTGRSTAARGDGTWASEAA